METELNSILLRLQDVRNEDFGNVLSSLLPRIVPLANKDAVREQVVAIITQALKRTKLHDCSIDLSVFVDLIVPDQLPFGCNFALVFLETLDSGNRIVNVDPATMAKVVLAAYSHKLFSHQSNSLLYYALKHCAVVDSAMLTAEPCVSAQVLHFLGDYFVDFCILDRVVLSSAAGSGGMMGGLSEPRSERVLLRRKQFTPQSITSFRIALLDMRCLSIDYTLAMAVLCLADSEPEVVSKAVFVVNRLTDNGFNFSARLPTLSTLISLFFALSEDGSSNLLRKRMPFRSPHRLAFLKILAEHMGGCDATTFDVILPVLEKLFVESGQMVRSDANGKQMLSLLHILSTVVQKLDSGSRPSTLPRCIAVLKALIKRWKLSNLYADGNDEQNSAVRSACYDMIAAIAVTFPADVADVELIQLLFGLAEPESYTASCASLFHVIGKLLDPCKEAGLKAFVCPGFFSLKNSAKPSCRLSYLQWLEVISSQPIEILQGLTDLADDKVEVVSKAAITLFTEYSSRKMRNAEALQDHAVLVVQSFLRHDGLHKTSFSLDMTSHSRPLFLHLKIMFETFHSVVGGGQQCQVAPQLACLLCQLVKVLSEGFNANASIPLDVKKLFLYVDDRFCSAQSLLLTAASGVEPTAVDFACQIIKYAVDLSDALSIANMSTDCGHVLVEKWLPLPTKMTRVVIGQVLIKLIESVSADARDIHRTKFLGILDNAITDKDKLLNDDAAMMSAAAAISMTVRLAQSGPQPDIADMILSLLALFSSGQVPQNVAQRVLLSELLEAAGKLAVPSPSGIDSWTKLVGSYLACNETFISQAAYQCVTRIGLLHSIKRKEASAVLFKGMEKVKQDRVLAFTVAEGLFLLHIAELVAEPQIGQTWDNLLALPSLLPRESVYQATLPLLHHLEALQEVRWISPVVLLVVTKSLGLCGSGSLPFNLFERLLRQFLLLMRSKDGFVQDTSCMGLCTLHALSVRIDKERSCLDVPEQVISKFGSLSAFISSEIVVVLTREVRAPQPAGYDSYGRDGSQAAAADDTEANHADADLIADELLTAANAAATSHLSAVLNGITLQQREQTAALAQAERRADRGSSLDNYGVYTKICSIAKKSGESAVIMLVLSLIRCDPTFGGDRTAMLYQHYHVNTVQLDPARVIPLLPMLFMAKFDPLESVREVMKSVWAQLVPGAEQPIVSEHFHRIVNCLMDNLLNPRWRERESCCIALDDVLLNRSWSTIHSYVPLLLTKGFLVMDDLRESTRKAAAIFMKTLLVQVLSACDSSETTESTAHETVSMVLPLLLDLGMVSPSIEARGFSLGALVKIVGKAKHNLNPWLERLIDALLESISALEPQLMQYMQFHVHTMKVSNEEWENKRLQLSQHSPMHDALQQCLELVPLEKIPSVCAIIYRHLAMGVGLPTRVEAANSFSFLVEKFPSGMARSGVQAFHLICQTLFDRPHLSSSLRKAMVNALGMLSKVVHEECLADEAHLMLIRYQGCSGQESDLSLAIASCAQQVVKKAGDRMTSPELIANLLTTAYTGSYDPDTKTQSLWADTFGIALGMTSVGTKLSALRIALLPITRVVVALLINLSWDRRKQGIAIARDLIASLPWDTLVGCFPRVLAALLCSLRATAWQGQEQALECIAVIVTKAAAHYRYDAANEHIGLSLTLPHGILQISLADIGEFQTKVCGEIQEQLREVLAQDASPSVLCTSDWFLSPRALVKLFVQELSRKEADYRFCAARAMSLLPWQTISAQDPFLLQDYLPFILTAASLQAKPRDCLPAAMESGIPVAASTKTTIASSNSGKSGMNNSALFGSRYGAAKPARPLKRVAAVQISKPIAPVLTNSPPSANDAMETEVFDSAAINEPRTMEAISSKKTIAGRDASMDPAFRMLLLDTLSSGWPKDSTHQLWLDTASSLLLWIEDSLREEVWSVRKASVGLLAAISSRVAMSDQQLCEVMRLFRIAFLEPKYVKVKLTVLEGLESVMHGTNKVALKASCSNDILSIVRQATADTQPSILEAAAKLQRLLLTF